MTPQVEVDGVHKVFGRTRALAGLGFSAPAGIFGLLGPNGAGKTTLLRLLATVLAADAGTVRLLGLDPTRPDDRLAIRRRLGYLPRTPASTATSGPSSSSTTWPSSRRLPLGGPATTRSAASWPWSASRT